MTIKATNKKPTILLVALAAMALTLVSCGDIKDIIKTGGAIEVKNEDTTYDADISIAKILSPLDPLETKKAAHGKTVKFSVSEDGSYIVSGSFHHPSLPEIPLTLPITKTIPLVSGGGTQKIELKSGL
jgi:hypothetical protein